MSASNHRAKRVHNRSAMCEPLEARQLMSLTVSVREADGSSSATVTSVGQVLNLELLATITSSNGAAAQDFLQDADGKIISTAVGTHSVAGNLAATNVAPFNATGAFPGTQQDVNGDGNIDVGGIQSKSTIGNFGARSTSPEGSTAGTTVGNSLVFVIADLTYTVIHLNGGGTTDINFAPAVSNLPDAASWAEAFTSLNNTSGVYQAGTPFTVSDPALLVPLKGKVIGTAGSYRNIGNTITNVFDGNLSTYFDAPVASGNWAGLDLNSPYAITQINYAPRSGWAGRMIGGVFQGSNDPTFSTVVVPLAKINSTPATGAYTSIDITVPSTFRYVRYLSPTGSYGNIAELQFIGVPASVAVTALAGTVIGTSGSWQGDGNTIANAFDGDLTTFVDAAAGSGAWTGLDLGTAKTITQISYAPRAGWASRMIGGTFQASNSATFSSGVVNLYTVTATPAVGALTTADVNVAGTYRYVRYLSPANAYCNIAEAVFYG